MTEAEMFTAMQSLVAEGFFKGMTSALLVWVTQLTYVSIFKAVRLWSAP